MNDANWKTELQEQRYQERIAELETERNEWHKAYKGIKRDLEQVQQENERLQAQILEKLKNIMYNHVEKSGCVIDLEDDSK